MNSEHVMILGVGNILLSDEGFGIRVVEALEKRYAFPDNVSVIDGGVLGINLMGIISEADQLIVVDVIRNQGEPGNLRVGWYPSVETHRDPFRMYRLRLSDRASQPVATASR